MSTLSVVCLAVSTIGWVVAFVANDLWYKHTLKLINGFYHATIELLESISDVVNVEWEDEDE